VKIALATDWFPPRQGGIESQLAQLATRLVRRGHAVDVLTSTPKATDANGYRVRSLSGLTVPALDLALSPRLLDAVRAELARGYDVLHAHISVVSPLGYAAAVAGRSRGIPTVVTFHSVLRRKRLLLRAANAILDLASSPVVWSGVSDLVAGQLREALAGIDVVVLPNGVDLDFWDDTVRAPDRETPRPVTLISATRLHRKKRTAELLAAFANATARTNVPATLVLAGDGPRRAAIARDIRSRGLEHGRARVQLVGWQTPQALRELYASADAFVLASTRESFGIAALEASVAGLPIIAMSESGCREFVGNGAGGHLCADDTELTEALRRVIENPPRRSRMSRAHLMRYDWPAVLASHEATYQQAIERATAASRPAGTSG
jgi:glycosyltransferase involved in cell wall biosynthesis